MNLQKQPFGTIPNGRSVSLFTLSNDAGVSVRIINYGATIIAVEAPDRRGRVENITLSLDSLAAYLAGHPCLGSTIGRFANRIARGRFSIGDKQYVLATNDGPNHLHGGLRGFDKVLWSAEPVENQDAVGVAFTYHSPDGEEGYPGNLTATVVYSLTKDNRLLMDYSASTDQTTVVNLTNHVYWNLADGGRTDVLGHELTIHADRYLEVDAELTPTGRLLPVAGTPLDFTTPKCIGAEINRLGGYDHCYVLNAGGAREPIPAARVVEPRTGRTMEVFTTEPGVQFYSANGLDGTLKGGYKTYRKYAGLCLEAQHFPDSPNHSHFPTTLLHPGQQYRQLTVHKFGVE